MKLHMGLMRSKRLEQLVHAEALSPQQSAHDKNMFELVRPPRVDQILRSTRTASKHTHERREAAMMTGGSVRGGDRDKTWLSPRLGPSAEEERADDGILDLLADLEEEDEECAWSPGSSTGRQGTDLINSKRARQSWGSGSDLSPPPRLSEVSIQSTDIVHSLSPSGRSAEDWETAITLSAKLADLGRLMSSRETESDVSLVKLQDKPSSLEKLSGRALGPSDHIRTLL